MNTEQPETARIDATLPQHVLELIKTAADLQGRSLTDFVVGSARKAAERTIEGRDSILLSAEDQVRFANALLSPSEPSPAILKSSATHARIESDSAATQAES